jgi:hypothetical protein
MAQPFYLEKILAKPGDTIAITQSCVNTGTTITSSDESVAFITAPYSTLHATGIGKADIVMNDITCGSGTVTLQVTDDGTAPIMDPNDYIIFGEIEAIVYALIIMVATAYRIKYWI